MNISMRSKKRIVINYFLRALKDKMQWEDCVDEISLRWLKIYNKAELKEIVKWLFMQKIPEEMDLDNMDEEELLLAIGDDYHILGYLLDQMDKELEAYENPTQEILQEVLVQLASETHYLASKPIESWDDYDRSNYHSLLRKAGKPEPLYGVYDVDVREEDRYTVTLPENLYHSSREALRFLSELVEGGQFEDQDLKIMKL